ncbi:hypothetical protein ACWGF3_27955 [Streptomyces xanthophaeus]
MSTVVDVPEYLDGCELTAAEDLAREPAFWLAHLLLTKGDPGERPEEYGVDASAYEAIVDRLSDCELPWPVLRIGIGGGHTVFVVYANDEEADNVDFFVRHPQWGRLGYLAQCGADDAGPGLSWTELVALAASGQSGQDDDEGLSDPSQRLLLLLPALGDCHLPAEARDTVARALSRVGIRGDATAVLAASLLPGPGRADGPRWTVTDASPLAVCSSPYSPRRVPLALGITPEQARALADALGGR